MGPLVNVLWSKETRQVLYIEAGKDFVDLLLSILRMPTVTVLDLIKQEGLTTPGDEAFAGIVNLHHALTKLDGSALKVSVDSITSPPLSIGTNMLSLTDREGSEGGKTFAVYRCTTRNDKHAQPLWNNRGSTTTCLENIYWERPQHCPGCRLGTFESVTVIGEFPGASSCNSQVGHTVAAVDGFVKENITFMVTDNLDFYQTSTIKSISLLNKLGVKNMSDLQDMDVEVDQPMAISLIKSALTSNTVLNDVFGPKVKAKSLRSL